jgi:alkanesulfonate monooxygenase SsuD/methylene tetrahydromethanopterin reductase-like flavin-dependent oxidoreductase (luciferase family)
LRLAEDAAVVDLLSRGRLSLVIAGGYVVEEFAMFDVPLGERAPRTTETVRVLQQAWTGEPFDHRGRRVQVTPRPFREGGPHLLLGGSSDAAARRAARLGVGYQPSSGASWGAYQAECVAQGRPDPGAYLGGDTTVVILAADPDAAWAELEPYALHETSAYGSWAAVAGAETGYSVVADADALRASGRYRVLTPDALVADLAAQGPGAFALFHPMLGGVPPEMAWESLHLFEHEVLPRL